MISAHALPWLAYAMSALFMVGGAVNFRPPPAFQEAYARWGYPSWWHLVTAALDFAGAAMLPWQPTRIWGAVLLTIVTLAAIATLLRFKEFKGLPPAFLLLGGTVSLIV